MVSDDGGGRWTWWLLDHPGVLAWASQYVEHELIASRLATKFRHHAATATHQVACDDLGGWSWSMTDGHRTVGVSAERYPTRVAAELDLARVRAGAAAARS